MLAAFDGLGDISGRMGSNAACSGRACWYWQGTGETLERSGSSRSKGRGTELANLEAGNRQQTLGVIKAGGPCEDLLQLSHWEEGCTYSAKREDLHINLAIIALVA